MRKTTLMFLCLSVAAMSSCRMVSSIVHDDEVVAKVGNEMLYKREVEALIPEGTSSGDSLRLAMQYINTWAADQVFLNVAEDQLPKAERDVSKELEAYRRSLLKYRYEQQYINERLDTAVTMEEIKRYYNEHSQTLILSSPVVKARFLKTSRNSPNLKTMRQLMSSGEEDALWEAENLALASADIFTGYGGDWIDVRELARDMGMEAEKIVSAGEEKFVEATDAGGTLSLAYIVEFKDAGELAPIEYCTENIKDMIISTRKRRLISDLEEELLTNARDKGKFVIY